MNWPGLALITWGFALLATFLWTRITPAPVDDDGGEL